MDVYWMEQRQADVAVGERWLSAMEIARLSALHIPKRHADWRLGRWTAKQAVAAYLKLGSDAHTLASIEIRASDSGAPEVFLEDQVGNVAISISHRAQIAACSIAPPDVTLGCDLEVMEARSDAFVEDYFTDAEQELVSCTTPMGRNLLLALMWSAKESALKALRTGLRMDTRSVSVDFGEDFTTATSGASKLGGSPFRYETSGEKTWKPLRVCVEGGGIFPGWWQRAGTLVRTLVADPGAGAPIMLVAER